jgi:predicted amidohydrolase YtcJ
MPLLAVLLAGAAVADLVLVGGRVHTMDPQRQEATAVAIRGERIVAVGSDAEARRFVGPGTEVLSLGGRAVLPGLIDTHTHAFEAARARTGGWVDVGLPDVRSLADAVAALGKAPGDGWVLGDRWDESKWPERRYLRRGDLDPVTGGRPTYVEHVSGHAATANSAALRRAGITRDTPDPTGGAIERDASGEATGVLKDTAMALVTAQLPPSTFGRAERVAAAAWVSDQATAVGLTTIHDSALVPEAARAYQEAEADGRLKVRVRAIPLVPAEGTDEAIAHLAALGVHTGHGSAHLRWGAVKFFTDGGMAARTIAVTAPGPGGDPANLGLLRWDTPRLTAAMKAVRALGWQITAHAIGDRAIAQTLDALEAALGPEPGDHRSRIVHGGVTTPALLDRMARLGVAVDHNPPFVYWIGDWFRNYGEARARSSYRGRSYERHGVRVSGGSDFSVTPLSPWWGVWAAVERREYRTGEVLGEGETVDAGTALRWYTSDGAWAGFDEADLGALAPGRLADLVVLDRDPLAVPADAIKDTRVLATLVGGERVREDAVLGWPERRRP